MFEKRSPQMISGPKSSYPGAPALNKSSRLRQLGYERALLRKLDSPGFQAQSYRSPFNSGSFFSLSPRFVFPVHMGGYGSHLGVASLPRCLQTVGAE